jgi:hypothetical protein
LLQERLLWDLVLDQRLGIHVGERKVKGGELEFGALRGFKRDGLLFSLDLVGGFVGFNLVDEEVVVLGREGQELGVEVQNHVGVDIREHRDAVPHHVLHLNLPGGVRIHRNVVGYCLIV